MGIFWSRASRQEESHDDGEAPLEREPSPADLEEHGSRRGSEVRGDPGKQQAAWVADAAYNHCQLCKLQFSWVQRRHHCRQCGSLVCQQCSPHRAIARGFTAPVRVCAGCFGAMVLAEQSAAASRANSQASSRRSSPTRLVADRHAQHKAQKEAEQDAERQAAVDAANRSTPQADVLIRQHHTSHSSTSITVSAPDDVSVSLPPHHTPASSIVPTGHSSTLSLSVGGASTNTEVPSPSAGATTNGSGSTNSSPRTGVRRLSVSREPSPSASSGGRRKSISGQPAFQPQHSETPESSPLAASAVALVSADSAAAASAPSVPPSVPRFQVDTLAPLVLFNRLAGFGSLLVLDVRSSDEYKAGHVPRALHLPLTDGDLLPADAEGELQSAECTTMLSALEQRLHMTDQRAFRMRQRCTVVLVGAAYSDPDPASATRPSPYTTAPFLSARHSPLCLHLARLLQLEGKVAAVSVLAGGYDAFAAAYPFVCCSYKGLELKSGKHLHTKPFPWYPNEIISAAAAHAVSLSSSSDSGEDGGIIFLGSKVDASNLEHLKHLGISYVLNCTEEVPCFFEEEKAADGISPLVTYRRILILDEVEVPIAEHFREAFAFMEEALRANKRLLIHCHEGISRSATILIAFLMTHSDLSIRGRSSSAGRTLSLHDAYQWVKSMRRQIFPNLGFWKQLSAFELVLQRDRLLQEARSTGADESSVPPIDQLKGTLDDCIDVALLTAEYKARKETQLKYAAAAAASAEEASAELTTAQRMGTLKFVKGVASEDAHDRAQEAIVEEAQTPCGPIVTSD